MQYVHEYNSCLNQESSIHHYHYNIHHEYYD